MAQPSMEGKSCTTGIWAGTDITRILPTVNLFFGGPMGSGFSFYHGFDARLGAALNFASYSTHAYSLTSFLSLFLSLCVPFVGTVQAGAI